MANRREWGSIFKRCGCKAPTRCGHPWYVRFVERGVRRKEAVGPDRAHALIRLRKIREALAEEEATGRRPLAFLSFGEFWDATVAPHFQAKHRASTWASECRRAAVAREWFGAKALADVGEGDVRKFLDYLRMVRGVSGATVNRYRVLLSRAWDLAVADGAARENIVRHVKRSPEPLPDRDVIRREDIARVLSAVSPAFYAPCALLAWTGARRAEIAALRWSDHDTEAGTLTIPGARRKTGKPVTLYLCADAQALLARLRADRGPIPMRGEEYVFPAAVAEHPECLSNAWIRARRKLVMPPGKPGRPKRGEKRPPRRRPRASELPGAKLHGLRHAMGDALGTAGVAPAVIAQVLGHASLVTTMRYIRGRDEVAARAAVLGVTEGTERRESLPTKAPARTRGRRKPSQAAGG